ncbi:MAG: zinc-ribbon domain-containing protein [Ruminococcaceae bacterium]|nr:zinc-ribbon domain-containing protein [Oscillospiraceae bacterium]
MAFFDDLGKKITQVSQSAVQKTKDMTGIAKYSAMISDEEKKIKELYTEIGSMYVQLHADETEGQLGEKVCAVKEAEKKIEEYNQIIKELRGYVHCENCGAEVLNSMSFCSNCGKAMPKPEVEVNNNLVKCSACGNMVDKAMRFCTKCGNPMAAAQQQQKKFCTNCGKELSADAAFCTECGTKV